MNARTPQEHLQTGEAPGSPDLPADLMEAVAALALPDAGPASAFEGLLLAAREATGRPLARIVLTTEAQAWFGPAAEDALYSGWPADLFGPPPAGRSGLGLQEVTDAAADPRWQDHPLVAGPPHLRSHAAQPLILGTRRVGSLCVMDTLPGTLSRSARATLAGLAQAAVALLEGRREAAQRQRQARHLVQELQQALVRMATVQALRTAAAPSPRPGPVAQGPAAEAGLRPDDPAAANGPPVQDEARALRHLVHRALRVVTEQVDALRVAPDDLERHLPTLTRLVDYASGLSQPARGDEAVDAPPSAQAPGTDPQDVLDTCVAVLMPDSRARRVHLTVRVADGTPALHAPVPRLVPLLLNLLDNALVQSPEGAMVHALARATSPDDEAADPLAGGVTFQVSDQGGGLPPSLQEALAPGADPALRALARRSTPALRRVLQQVDALAGTLHVVPGRDRGTVVRLVLPAAPA